MRCQWEGLTSGGWAGAGMSCGRFGLRVGLQHGVGGAAVQQGHLTLPYDRRDWMEGGG